MIFFFFFSSRRRHTRFDCDWSSDVCSSDLDQGWSTEIDIPIQSITFKNGITSWGFNIERNIQRLQEISRWSGISRDIEIFQSGRAGLLTDLPPLHFGRGFTVRPSVIGNLHRAEPAQPSDFAGDVSLDM